MTIRLSRRSARVIGAVGRGLIGFGVVTLLFVAYQLWGTGFQHSRAQQQMAADFEAQLQAANDSDSTPVATTTTTTEALSPRGIGSEPPISFPGVTTTTTAPEEVDPEVLAAIAPTLGEPVVQVQIPSIGVDETVVYGIRVSDLRKGPGLFPGNPLPGTPGNAAIAGHRTTYGAPFHDLNLIEPGDEIVVTTLRGEFTYVVESHDGADGNEVGHFIVAPEGVHVLDDQGDNRITLIACHPKFSARQRIIVTGILEEEPIEPPPPPADPVPAPEPAPQPAEPDPLAEDGWGDGLDGDRDALVPTLVWAGLFGLGLLGAWFGGQIWRRWPAYVLSTPVVAWLLWNCFFYLDRLLPSY